MATTLIVSCECCQKQFGVSVSVNFPDLQLDESLEITSQVCPDCGGKLFAPAGTYKADQVGILVPATEAAAD